MTTHLTILGYEAERFFTYCANHGFSINFDHVKFEMTVTDAEGDVVLTNLSTHFSIDLFARSYISLIKIVDRDYEGT